MASMLANFIAIKSDQYPTRGHITYRENGFPALEEQDVFSPMVKIEVERAEISNNYVHLRFSYSNRYWARQGTSGNIAAVRKQPEEDTSKTSCTLFEPVKVANRDGVFYLRHVQTGWRVGISVGTYDVVLFQNAIDPMGFLTFMDMDALVKLPPHVAFKGDNGKYLKAYLHGDRLLQFGSDDANEILSGHKVDLTPDGYVRLSSDHFNFFWISGSSILLGGTYVLANSTTGDLYLPVKVDDNTIALRGADKRFCTRLSTGSLLDCLSPTAATITKEARLVVQELVLNRHIYNVRYLMEHARIYDETPYVAGTSMLTNDGYEEAAVAVEITYEDSKSYTFSRSLSLTAGVSTTFQTGVPFIASGEIEVSFEINTTLQWDTSTTTTTSITASGSVPVPARSWAVIEYVGTRGTCDVPYTYTQRDRRSTDGVLVYTDQIDGTYNGVSCYNFHFVVKTTQALV